MTLEAIWSARAVVRIMLQLLDQDQDGAAMRLWHLSRFGHVALDGITPCLHLST
jgi:hypothetical protein